MSDTKTSGSLPWMALLAAFLVSCVLLMLGAKVLTYIVQSVEKEEVERSVTDKAEEKFITEIGATAYRNGIPTAANPFVTEYKRIYWYQGWIKAYLETRQKEKGPNIFQEGE